MVVVLPIPYYVSGHVNKRIIMRRVGLTSLVTLFSQEKLPFEYPIDFVQSNDERRLFLLKKIDRFERLRFQSVHNVHDKNGHVAQVGPTRT